MLEIKKQGYPNNLDKLNKFLTKLKVNFLGVKKVLINLLVTI